MPQNSPDVVRVAAVGTYQGQQFINTFHFQKRDESAVTPAELALLAGILDDANTDSDSIGHLYKNQDATLAVTKLVLTTLGSGANPSYGLERTVAFAGTNVAGSDSQAMLAAVAKWGTGLASRRARGRSFFGGINTDMQDTDPDYLKPSYVTLLLANCQDFVTAWLANTTWAFVVNSYVVDGAVENTTITEITSTAINNVFAVQRRRRPRVTS